MDSVNSQLPTATAYGFNQQTSVDSSRNYYQVFVYSIFFTFPSVNSEYLIKGFIYSSSIDNIDILQDDVSYNRQNYQQTPVSSYATQYQPQHPTTFVPAPAPQIPPVCYVNNHS